MLHRPSVLLLDEPTRSLDPLAAAEFRRFLLQQIVGEHGTAVLFASHTLAEVEQLAGRVAVLDHGRLLGCDTPERLRTATGADTLEQSLEILTHRASRGNAMTDSSGFRVTLRKLAILFQRDLAVARSYRAAFVLELFYALFGVASFYFLSRFIDSPQLEQSLPQGTSYFSFVLVGLAFFDYLSVALHTFDESLQSARQNGTLENLLVTQTSLPVILAGSSLVSFCPVVVAHGDLSRVGRGAVWLSRCAMPTGPARC